MDYFISLILKYSQTGIIIDTNLLLLYLVGQYDQNMIGSFKGTLSYSEEDFKIVLGVLARFKKIIITPHILAELSNLSAKIRHDHLNQYFETLIAALSNWDEKHIEKSIIFNNN